MTYAGRKELLGWLNSFLQLDYSKVEQVATGAAHCQLMDAVFPGKVPLHRVNFEARYDYEYIANFKVLQAVFKEVGIVKTIDVNKLVKAKPQDNLEFLQWMKKFFDENYDGHHYPARERRLKSKTQPGTTASASGASASTSSAATKRVPSTSSSLNTSATSVTLDKENEPLTANGPSKTTAPVVAKRPAATQAPARKAVPVSTAAVKPKPASASHTAQIADLEAQVRKLTDKVGVLKATLDILKPEKEFYFEKLRYVEITCQTYSASATDISTADFIKKVESILYAESHTPEALADLIETAQVEVNDELDVDALEDLVQPQVDQAAPVDDIEDEFHMEDLPAAEEHPVKEAAASATADHVDNYDDEESLDFGTPASEDLNPKLSAFISDFGSTTAALEDDIFF